MPLVTQTAVLWDFIPWIFFIPSNQTTVMKVLTPRLTWYQILWHSKVCCVVFIHAHTQILFKILFRFFKERSCRPQNVCKLRTGKESGHLTLRNTSFVLLDSELAVKQVITTSGSADYFHTCTLLPLHFVTSQCRNIALKRSMMKRLWHCTLLAIKTNYYFSAQLYLHQGGYVFYVVGLSVFCRQDCAKIVNRFP